MDEAIERVEKAIEATRRGELVIILDAQDRENEGDLCIAAEHVTSEEINFMAKHGRGLICLAMTGERLDALDIPMMVEGDDNASQFGTAFTVSIEAKKGVTTGISAADRARTVQVAVDDETEPDDIVAPGHVFPLRARDGGVLVRTGQTEASVDLARLADKKPAAVICEIMNPDGTMARRPDLEDFAEEHDLQMVSVSDMVKYRLRNDSLVQCVEETDLPTAYDGDWSVRVYRSDVSGMEHLAFVCGEPDEDESTLVRVQHRCDTFDTFMRPTADTCAGKLGRVMAEIAEQGTGVVVYLDHDPKSALDMVDHYVHEGETRPHRTERDNVNQPRESLKVLGIGAQILAETGVGDMRLLTNRPKKAFGLDGYGLEIVDQVPIPDPNDIDIEGDEQPLDKVDVDDT